MKVGTIVVARMGSSRLPGKVLKQVEGRSLLDILLGRARRARRSDVLLVATSDTRVDDPIVAEAERLEVPTFRGSESDTMDRFYGATCAFGLDIAVRVTGDCPLVDPTTIDLVIETALRGDCDYVSTDLVPQYPNGMGCDAYTRAALERLHEASRDLDADQAWMLTRDPSIGLQCGLAPGSRWGDLSRYRLTVDTPQDFDLVGRVLSALLPGRPDFGLDDVVTLLERHPGWLVINAGVVQKTGPHKGTA